MRKYLSLLILLILSFPAAALAGSDAVSPLAGPAEPMAIAAPDPAELVNAAAMGDAAQIDVLLKLGADANAAADHEFSGVGVCKRCPAVVAAAYSGNTEAVKLLLDAGADANAKDGDGLCALFPAAYQGHVEVTRMLVARGADPNAKSAEGITPVFAAAFQGNSGVIKALADGGADINMKSDDGITPLFLAALNGHTGAIRELINNGARINETSAGFTPLFAAVFRSHPDAATALIESGAAGLEIGAPQFRTLFFDLMVQADIKRIVLTLDEMIKAGTCKNPLLPQLYKAIVLGNVKEALDLISNGKSAMSTEDLSTALVIATVYGETETASALLAAGAEVDAKAKGSTIVKADMTPLMIATINGNRQLVSILIGKGADVNIINIWDRGRETALSVAVERGDIDVATLLINSGARLNLEPPLILYATLAQKHELVKLLISKGADINEPSATGVTAASAAASINPEILKTLIDRKADLNKPNQDGTTPLMRAARAGNYESARMLIDAKANFRTRSQTGTTALSLAIESCNGRIIRLLAEKGAKFEAKEGQDLAVFDAVLTGDLPAMRRLLANGAVDNAPVPSYPNIEGITPLTLAVCAGRTDIARELLSRGTSPDTRFGRTGETLLMLAAKNGSTDIIKMLLGYKADIKARNMAGRPVIAAAVAKGNTEAARLLLSRGAEITEADAPLMLADVIEGGYVETLKFLLDNKMSPNGKLPYNSTLLSLAAAKPNTKILDLLIKAKANVNARDNEEKTPIFQALMERRLDNVLMLIKSGARVDVMDKQGLTPIRVAFQWGNVKAINAVTAAAKKVQR